MTSENQKAKLGELLYNAVVEEVQDLLKAGRVSEIRSTDDSGSPLITLEPMEQSAAPLEISVDTNQLVTCFPGREGMSCEFFARDPLVIEAAVRALVRAVIAGHYCEWANSHEAKTQIYAQWCDGETVESAGLNVLRKPKADSPKWRSVSYNPY